MKKFICVGEKYTTNEGEEKVSWKRLGEIFTAKNGKEYAKLYFMPSQLLSLFEDKPKQTQGPRQEFPLNDGFDVDFDNLM